MIPKKPALGLDPRVADFSDRSCVKMKLRVKSRYDLKRLCASVMEGGHARALDARQLAQEADPAGARLSGPGGARDRRATACDLSAAGFCRRGPQPEEGARPRRHGRGFPAARRRLRRELLRAQRQQCQRQQYPRLPARFLADGGGAHLCGGVAGGEGRPHRRTVREASHLADGEEGRQGTAELSRRHHQRRRVHRAGAPARPGAPDRGLPPLGRHAQSAARLRARRLRQSRQCAAVDARLRQGLPAVAPLRGARRPHFRGARLHAGLWARSREPSRAQEHRFLYQPRGAAARLRAGDDARGFDASRHLLLHLGAYAVDRRPHPPARSCPCRVLPRHHQSARTEMRAVQQGRRAAAPDRHSQSGERAGPADADRPARLGQGRRSACRP